MHPRRGAAEPSAEHRRECLPQRGARGTYLITQKHIDRSAAQGCMDPTSCNFNPEAEEDDGSCLPYDSTSGCTDSVACNYNSNAVCDDGSCIYPPLNLANCDDGEVTCGAGTYWDIQSQSCVVANSSDTDFDGCVGMIDLLDLLSVFGTCQEVGDDSGEEDGSLIATACSMSCQLNCLGHMKDTITILWAIRSLGSKVKLLRNVFRQTSIWRRPFCRRGHYGGRLDMGIVKCRGITGALSKLQI